MEDDWGYQLAQQVVDAAVSCGVDCPTRRVTEWDENPFTCVNDCGCELLVSVLEGLERGGSKAPCDMYRTARVELTLLVCWPPGERDGSRIIEEDAGLARDYSTMRWKILQGILGSWRRGDICIDGGGCIGAACTPMAVEGWNPRPTEGPCKAYSLVLRFREAI